MRESIAAVNKAVLEQAEIQHISSGTTAVFAHELDQQILIGHLGDSKALLCQHQPVQPPACQQAHHAHLRSSPVACDLDNKPQFKAVPLTADHCPDRSDEHARIEASGGFVCAASSGGHATTTLAYGFRPTFA